LFKAGKCYCYDEVGSRIPVFKSRIIIFGDKEMKRRFLFRKRSYNTLIYIPLLLILLISVSAGQNGWVPMNSGTTQHLYSVYFTDANHGWAAGRQGTVLKTLDGGNSWVTIQLPNNYNLKSICFADSLTGWVTGYKNLGTGIILKTNDSGISWSTSYVCSEWSILHSLYFLNADTGWAAGEIALPVNESSALILRTTDGGLTWNECQPWSLYGPVKSIYFLNSRLGWAAGVFMYTGITIEYPLLYRTINSGINWQSVSQYDSIYAGYHSIFFADSLTGWVCGWKWDDHYLNMYGIVRKSIDGGATWDALTNAEFLNDNFTDLFFINQNVGWVLGSYSNNIYKTEDGGLNWVAQPSNTTEYLDAVFFLNPDTGWVVGSHGVILKTGSGGVLSEPGNSESPAIPQLFVLHQNYPNPFNSGTIINYQLPAAGEVAITIYNLLGQKVRTLVSGRKPAGAHRVKWDGRDDLGREVASGVYVCRLKAGVFEKSSKMLLIR